MRAIDAIRRSAVGIEGERSVRDAAQLMEQAGVGTLVVLDGVQPVGIVTDRDIVRRLVARGMPDDARVDGVMTTPLVTIDANADLRDAYALFRGQAVRRLVVLRDGALVGVLSIDDLLVDLVGDLADLVRPVTAEIVFAHRDSGVPATT